MPQQYEPIDEYEALRRRAQQQAELTKQKNQEGLARKFATQGMSNSGAQMKLQQQTESDINRDLSSQQDVIGFQEAQERQRRREVGEGRAFQTSERLGGQEFATGQQVSQQKFAGQESAYQREQAQRFFDSDLEFKREQSNVQQGQFAAQINQSYREMELSQDNNYVSTLLAIAQIEDFEDLPMFQRAQIDNAVKKIPQKFKTYRFEPKPIVSGPKVGTPENPHRMN